MEIIKECNNNFYLNQTKSNSDITNNIQTEFNKRFKIVDYFDYIYNYPPKIKIKWDGLDELKDNSIKPKFNSIDDDFSMIDYIEDREFTTTPEKAVAYNYLKDQYFNGFLTKLTSSNFFLKKTNDIQTALSNIPVFVLLNGHGEVVLSKPSNVLGSKTFNSYVNEKLYDYCGGFDPIVEKKSELGLFFMNYLDAEKYLKEVARSDFEGTNTVGLSIHCINLESAYRITREYHPGIDFRFVPNFKEIKDLLSNSRKSIGNPDLIVENEQQQLRFRHRNVNSFPYLNKLGSYLSPQFSLLQRNEYFKGVPIYIVHVTEPSNNIIAASVQNLFEIINALISIPKGLQNKLNYLTGCGHSSLQQGSLEDYIVQNDSSEKVESYIFFEQNQAIEFCKKNKKNIVFYSMPKTKIFVYNLEDFLEDWEDNINQKLNSSINTAQNIIFRAKATHFVTPSITLNELNGLNKEDKGNAFKNLGQSLNVKIKVFKRAVGVFFSL